MKRSMIAAWFCLLALALTGCGDGENSNSGSNNNPYGLTTTGPGVLSASPLDAATLVYATPLGKLSPPGHVLATDHVYLSFVDPWSPQQQNNDCSPRPVYAAGAGVVYFLLQTETQGDTKMMIQMSPTFWYYYDHVIPLGGMQLGTRVTAGQQIATTTGRCPSMDLGVIDLDVNPPGFINPGRYGDLGAHVASPYKYFTPDLQTLYYAKVRLFEGVPYDKDGRVDWGKAGYLAGDWFHSSIANAPASTINGSEGWEKTISFAKDWFDGSPRISIGGTIATPKVLRIANAAAPVPDLVTPSSGLIAYEGIATNGINDPGWILVQMLDAATIKIEFFAQATTAPTAFTAAAQTYVR